MVEWPQLIVLFHWLYKTFPNSWELEHDRDHKQLKSTGREEKKYGWDSEIKHIWQCWDYGRGDSANKNCTRKSSLEYVEGEGEISLVLSYLLQGQGCQQMWNWDHVDKVELRKAEGQFFKQLKSPSYFSIAYKCSTILLSLLF